jgi:hypothetical protein
MSELKNSYAKLGEFRGVKDVEKESSDKMPAVTFMFERSAKKRVVVLNCIGKASRIRLVCSDDFELNGRDHR